MSASSETGYLFEQFVVSEGSDTADASAANPTPPEGVEEGNREGEQPGSQSSREEYGPGLIDFDDDPKVSCGKRSTCFDCGCRGGRSGGDEPVPVSEQVWGRFEDGSLNTMALSSMWEVLEELVIPPPGK